MHRNRVGMALALLVFLSAGIRFAEAQEIWSVPKGSISIGFDQVALNRYGLRVLGTNPTRANLAGSNRRDLALDKATDLSFLVGDHGVAKVYSDRFGLAEGLRLMVAGREAIILDILVADKSGLIAFEETVTPDSNFAKSAFELHGVRVSFNKSLRTFGLHAETVRISGALAQTLGDTRLAGVPIGTAVLRGVASPVGADRPATSLVGNYEPSVPVTASAPAGPDITFCELYGLSQFGRLGSTVGLSIATTSWNVGTQDAIWFDLPDERHPFIGMNLYRLKDDRFEQIGQSWVKHAFFALDSEQCGTECTYEPGSGHGIGNWLGVGCTDTYSSSLNASQSGLGPRFEINPWNGAYEWTGSHMQNPGSPAHSAISHRLQVHDDDLRADFNPLATYYTEGYYVVGDNDDVNHMDSAAWKSVIPGGSPGGTWSFAMSAFSVAPNIGFALDAWTGARKTIIAQVLPVLERVSPDGRSILGAKATGLGDGVWHYEYALVNVDMNRKVNSFRVPFRVGATITNVGFHAPLSHDEPFSNTPWSSTIESEAVVWTTANNPVRWGTLYNFRFDADAPPVDTTVTLGLYETGTPTEVQGVTTGPAFLGPNCFVPSIPTAAGGGPMSRYVAVQPGNAGEQTAIRVKLTALLQTSGGETAGSSSQFAGFEGQYRWAGPPAQYPEGTNPIPTFFAAAALQCTPHFTDWGALGTVHVYGAEIMPFSSYDVQLLHEECAPGINDPSVYSSALNVPTAVWGDALPPFGSVADRNNQPNFIDIAGVVEKFRDAVGAPAKARTQLQPNLVDPAQDVGFNDISTDVEGFRGLGYPFAGPTNCSP